MQILFGSHDFFTFLMMRPVAEALLEDDNDVVIASAGITIEKWKEWAVSGNGPAWAKEGRIHLLPSFPSDQAIRKSSYVVVGTATTPEHERALLEKAWSFKIPTAILVDVPGGHRRLGINLALTNHFLVADEATKKEVLRDYPGATITTVGSPAVNKLACNQEAVKTLDGKKLVQWIGSTDTKDLEIVVGIMEQFLPDHHLFFSLHPDPAKRPPGKTVEAAIASIKDRLIYDLPGGMEAAMMEAEYVFGGFSLALNLALYNGRRVISIETPTNVEAARAAFPGVNQFPLVKIGATPLITRPVDPVKLDYSGSYVTLSPYDTSLVIQVLKS